MKLAKSVLVLMLQISMGIIGIIGMSYLAVAAVGADATGSAIASWVQGIGTVVAMYGAAVIAQKQHNNALQIEKLHYEKSKTIEQHRQCREELQRFEIISQVNGHIRAIAEICKEDYANRDKDIADSNRVRLLKDAKLTLERLPLFEFPDAMSVMLVGSLPQVIDALVDELGTVIANSNQTDSALFTKELNSSIDMVLNICGDVSEHCGKQIHKRKQVMKELSA